MRRLIYYVAVSVDGFIAQTNGSFDGFLPQGDHIQDYLDSLHNFDTVIMGRKTYEVGLNENVTDPYPTMDTYVFSISMTSSPNSKVHLISNNAIEKVQDLKKQDGKAIYLCGGAGFATQLLDAGLTDELHLKVNPFIMGSGIPLFHETTNQAQLKLFDKHIYENGVMFLYYNILKKE